MEEKIKGIVDKIIYEKDGYNIALIKRLDNSEFFTGVITNYILHTDLTFDFYGKWITDKKFGKQFKVEKLFEIKPDTTNGLIRYLSSKLFPGIGPTIARKIVNHYGKDNVIKTLDSNMDSLINIDGISPKKLVELKLSWKKNRVRADVLLFLHEYNITTNLAEKIYKEFGNESIEKLKENPYILVKFVYGVGFIKADEIALKLGIDEDSIYRVEAVIVYILNEITNSGHCYLTDIQLKNSAEKLLKKKLDDNLYIAINNLKNSDEIVEENIIIDENKTKIYYNNYTHACEKYCSDTVNTLINSNTEYTKTEIRDIMTNLDLTIGLEQAEAVINSISSRISIITGGPGTGKSFTLNAILKVIRKLGLEYELAAPTGRAAQKMMDATGREAKTIHRLLGWDFARGKVVRNEVDKLECNFLIIDESSMIDIYLASSLLKAVPSHCSVIFIGDIDQLPPVGPGNFFKDLIYSGKIPTSRLTKIYRQSKNSSIVSFAHDINKKILPNIPSPFENPNIWNEEDCIFIDSDYAIDENTPEYSSLNYGRDINKMIVELYSTIIPKYLGANAEIQVLCPLKTKGRTSVIELNKQLQNKVNPLTDISKELFLFDTSFRVGDRVMQVKNNYNLDVFNGDIGIITYINKKDWKCVVSYQNKDVHYEKENLKELELARACSIHKSQGSEFDCVIIPILNEHYIMLYNSLIYTALTRAKKLAVFVGSKESLKIAVKNFKPNERQTRLMDLIKN